jgi:hypothetical protein
MSAPKHTPGPWRAADYMAPAELIEGPDGENLAMRQDGTVADIKLMACAPDLRRELRAAHKIIQNALAVMTTEQKLEWGRLNKIEHVDGEGITRANERAAVIAQAGGAA